MEPTYSDIINPVYPNKLVDLIDEHLFGNQAHKVRELNERLDPVSWQLLRDLLQCIKVSNPYKRGTPDYDLGYEDGYDSCYKNLRG